MVPLLVGLQSLVAVVFTVSAVSKARSAAAYAEFAADVRRLVPAGPPRVLAGTVVAGEAAVPVLLAVPGTAPAGFAVAVLLLAGFTAAILGALRRGETAPCRCFGTSGARLGRGHVVR
ncbi:MauE/DoxX family redox-associated membrane protein, partial [Actinomadura sp. CNU-125]|uniref:MauE/DoxX family redox-associated membrane protein n=1 Tax=Actinomadura sp. CNU-125 TaxID=1904961 RepID=UPI003966B555